MNGIFGSAVLDTAIGLVLVYLLLSLICTTINEWISGLFRTRARFLQQALMKLLAGQPLPGLAGAGNPGDLLQSFYGHPLVNSMTQVLDLSNSKAHPSYLAPRTFARALIDVVTPNHPGTLTFKDLEASVKELPPGRVRTALLSLVQDADGSLEQAQRNIEAWYDDAMDRVNGWYKRHIQWVTVIVAAALTVAMNADTLRISSRLWSDPGFRELSVQRAKERVRAEQAESGTGGNSDAGLVTNLLGWQNDASSENWFEKLLGLLLTIVAVSLGAPFWFDILNKMVNLRSAGKSPDERAKAPEKLKQPPADRAA